ncbi:MAG: putative PEP-binding protein, partial [bacterium]
MNDIFTIGQAIAGKEPELERRLGIQGATVMQLAATGVDFLPGFITGLDDLRQDFNGLFKIIEEQGIPEIEKTTGRLLGGEPPLTLKITLLLDLMIDTNPVISWLGIDEQNLESLIAEVGERVGLAAFKEWVESFAAQWMIRLVAEHQTAGDGAEVGVRPLNHEETRSRLKTDIPQEASAQLRRSVEILLDNYDADPLNQSLPAAVMIQYLPLIDLEDPHTRGCFIHRDPDSGKCLQQTRTGQNENLRPEQLAKLKQFASILETWYLDIRKIHYLVENDTVWITDQLSTRKSVHARLKLLSELFQQEKISDRTFVNAISPEELRALFYPGTDPASTAGLVHITGAKAGSPGACSGRVYFSARNLKTAYWHAKAENRDLDFILLRERTHAEDLEAIQLSRGVITSRGGYTSHAPIVARYLGKPAVIHPLIAHFDDHITIGDQRVTEGQMLSMDVQDTGEPAIFIGRADIRQASYDSADLQALLNQARGQCLKTKVRANAETETEAHLAKEYCADGIGLCRTEHMLLEEDRLEMLRAFIVSEDEKEKLQLLEKIDTLLSEDFLTLFRIMDGLPLTIRLLDAPLHEFFLDQTAPGQLQNLLKQTNPMLGHRGCRLGISMPELYEMQVHAILSAALQANTREGIPVRPEILVPFIMSHREMALLRNGNMASGHSIRGINEVIRQTVGKAGLDKLPFEIRIGAVIEIPAAALSASKVVHQAEI